MMHSVVWLASLRQPQLTHSTISRLSSPSNTHYRNLQPPSQTDSPVYPPLTTYGLCSPAITKPRHGQYTILPLPHSLFYSPPGFNHFIGLHAQAHMSGPTPVFTHTS